MEVVIVALLFVPIAITGPIAGVNYKGVPTGVKLLLFASAKYT